MNRRADRYHEIERGYETRCPVIIEMLDPPGEVRNPDSGLFLQLAHLPRRIGRVLKRKPLRIGYGFEDRQQILEREAS